MSEGLLSEVEQRVAQAIQKVLNEGVERGGAHPTDLARAAMFAMREPTEAMIRAGHVKIDWCREDHDTSTPDGVSMINGQPSGTSCREDLTDAWRAMIDEAFR